MILVVGDTHGDHGFWYERVIPAAKRYGVQRIVQLGDFGYWEHSLAGVKYLHRLSEWLSEADMAVYFVDGNHENHTWLRSVYAPKQGQPEPCRIRKRIYWLPRGSAGTWEGVRWLACGGAYSIDKPGRVPGQSWWPEETITDKEVNACRARGRADVLFSHDCPLGVEPSQIHGANKTLVVETQVNRVKLTEVMKNSRAKLVMHGHWHEFHDDVTYEGVRVVGLGCNTNWAVQPALALLDLETLEVTPV